ncbi:MAG: F0F1 ATP synthase subunit epsilon [Hyphomicrobiales bacterium]|nr:F0F1 ATP synthase subunit epsilon [Rhizobiaceae bacterium]PCH49861.1 MAG: F0F1 ATP synthase subunit epsilon [Hyphomicrobiales bacterium]
MATAFSFELVSPEKLILSGEADEVIVPGSEGYFTVMANHAPLMSTIRPGIVEVKMTDGETHSIFVKGGFADVSPSGFTLLAELATPVADLSAEDLDKHISDADEAATNAKTDAAKEAAIQLSNQLKEVKAAL